MPIAPICSHPPLTSFRLRFSDHKILLRLTCGGACASHVNPTVLLMIWQNYQTSTNRQVLFNFQLNTEMHFCLHFYNSGEDMAS